MPGVITAAAEQHLRREPSGIVETRRVDHEKIRHGHGCQIKRASAGRAEAVRLLVPAVAGKLRLLEWIAGACHLTASREALLQSCHLLEGQ